MAAALETITVTELNVKEITSALQDNQINSLLIRVNEWTDRDVFLNALNAIAKSCEHNSSLKKNRVDQFDFKQSDQSGIVTPIQMANFLVTVANQAKQLQTIDLGYSRLHGCADFFKNEILKKIEIDNRAFKIICNGIPSVKTTPLANGKMIWQSDVREPGLFSHSSPAASGSEPSETNTPTSGKR